MQGQKRSPFYYLQAKARPRASQGVGQAVGRLWAAPVPGEVPGAKPFDIYIKGPALRGGLLPYYIAKADILAVLSTQKL